MADNDINLLNSMSPSKSDSVDDANKAIEPTPEPIEFVEPVAQPVVEPEIIPTPMEEINITPPTPLDSRSTSTYTSPPPYSSPNIKAQNMQDNIGGLPPIENKKATLFGTSLNFGGLNIDTHRIKDFAINFIVPIVCLGVSVLLFMVVVLPSITNNPKLDSDIRNKTKLKDTLTQKLSNLNRLLDFKSVVTENSDLVNKVMVSEGMVPELLNQVDVIAKASGLEVTRLSYSLAQGGTGALGYSAVDVALGARGNYGQLITFLGSVENAARLVNIANLRFSAGTKDTDILNFNIVLRSPYLYVNSEAVTDDPVDLDIANPQFTEFINKLKSLKYYDPKELPQAQIPEAPPEEQPVEGGAPAAETPPATEQPAAPTQ